MSEDLLAKEREFHRLNRELSEKTKDLMKEVDSVLTSHSTSIFDSRLVNERPGNFDSYRNETNFSGSKKNLKPIDVGAGGDESAFRRSTDGSENENLTVEEIASSETENGRSETFVRFLKTKIKLLREELETIRTEYKKKCNYCKELETESKKLDDSKMKLHNQTISLKDTIARLEANNASAQTAILSRETEIASLKKEIDVLKKEVKTVGQQSSNLDTRLNRSLEDNERLRNVVKANKIEDKELRDQIRRLQDNERLFIKNLERQRSEILQAFKKQTALVDNLKRQKVYLEASRHIQLTEAEFSKLLDWSPENT